MKLFSRINLLALVAVCMFAAGPALADKKGKGKGKEKGPEDSLLQTGKEMGQIGKGNGTDLFLDERLNKSVPVSTGIYI